jgi:uncharacterized membrane protein
VATQQRSPRAATRTAFRIGIIIGIGTIGAFDEIVFHQLLQWHNFYVHSTEYWRIFSDGVFHTFTAAMLVVGSIRLWMERRHLAPLVTNRPFWTGMVLGAGGFQLFDGTVNHKILRLHPVREGAENLWLYDVAWIASALVLLVIGWFLWHQEQAADRDHAAREADDHR